MTKRPAPLAIAVLRAKALAHPVRLRILAMLREGGLCVCQMTAVLNLAPSTVSAHLGDLKRAELVGESKAGKWVEYRLADDIGEDPMVASLFAALAADDQVRSDAALTRKLRKISLATLCAVELDLERLGLTMPAFSGKRSATRHSRSKRR